MSQQRRMLMTAKVARAVLGVVPNCSHCEARRAYRRQLLKTHPDKGGSPEAFSRVQRAWDVFARGNLDPRLQNSGNGKVRNYPSRLLARGRGVPARHENAFKQRPARARLSSIHRQPARSAVFKVSKQRHDDLLDKWCREALATSSHCVVTPVFMSSRSPSLRSGVTVDRGGTNRMVGRGHSVMKHTAKADKRRYLKGSRHKDSKRGEGSSKTDGQRAAGLALETYIRAERAAMAAVAKGVQGPIAKLPSPMLARHLRGERAAAAAAAVEQQLEQQKQEQQQQQPSLADLAAATRAMPREERRRFLMELPKATRLALETHVLAERKVPGSRLNGSATFSAGEVPQRDTRVQSETAKVSDIPLVCGRP
mmetsp:Transcript_26337/g.51619  ORF Transcript_26337/g.51619 Transcript_26337/m.51619 type:complete len:367 (+) Transcript_26337:67-1167(+)